MKGHKIFAVEKSSIAEQVEIEAGDILISINNEQIEDALDYHFLVNDDYLSLIIYKSKLDEEWEIEIEKEPEEDLGLVFENNLMDEYKSCTNNCIFCFIDQLPPNMRDTLYFKDDDSRLSFLQGNYITLTNMKEKDVEKIIKYHLSPINISVQTMNTQLRKKMLNNKFADRIIEYMELFYQAGIVMNGQIVLCKGINDGKELDYSIDMLTKYIPYLQSVSVVPVGLSKYREGLYQLEAFEKEDAKQVLSIIHKWQDMIYHKHNTHFIHAGDEFYFLADEVCPDEDNYDGYLQYENGVGMTRLLLDEFNKCYNDIKGDDRIKNISVATGVLIAPVIRELIDKIEIKFPNIKAKVYPIINDFFGHKITVSGLLTGQDIISQLSNKEIGDLLILPRNLLKNNEEILLDDISIRDIESALNTKILIVEPTGKGIFHGVLDKE